MHNTILDREFRDWSEECMYPFQDTSLLVNSQGIVINTDVFLDAVIYSVLDVTLPFFIAELDGSIGTDTQMQMTVKDNNNKVVCTGLVDYGTDAAPIDTSYLYDTYNRLSGTLVYQPAPMSQLVQRVNSLKYQFIKNQTSFLAERCYVTRSTGLSVIESGNSSYSDKVYIVGANGVHFTEESGEIFIHLLGEEEVIRRPIKTVNGIPFKHVWLAAHPNSPLKVETTGSAIKIWKISDA